MVGIFSKQAGFGIMVTWFKFLNSNPVIWNCCFLVFLFLVPVLSRPKQRGRSTGPLALFCSVPQDSVPAKFGSFLWSLEFINREWTVVFQCIEPECSQIRHGHSRGFRFWHFASSRDMSLASPKAPKSPKQALGPVYIV